MRFHRLLIAALALTSALGCSDDDSLPMGSGAATGTSGSGSGGSGGSGGDAGAYAVTIVPSDFSTTIDNPFLPWPPGMVLTYVEDETETIHITVTNETKTVMGVECVVVHDELSDADGLVIEDTYDWYAQDKDGNVWYFGEDTNEYDDMGVANPAGSWEAGVDGALPGIAMPGEAVVGEPYRQEYYAGEAEDMGQIIEVDQEVTVPAGTYSGCLVTKDWSLLTPQVVEHKHFCPGIGNVRAETISGATGLEELTETMIP